MRDYNFALSRVFSVIRWTPFEPWTRALNVPAPSGGEYVLTHRAIANRLWRPQDYELIPADELDVRGKLVVPRITREGAGATLVAVRRERAPQIPLRFAPPRVYTAVSAVARFAERKYEIELVDPLASETVVFGPNPPIARRFHRPNSSRSYARASREDWVRGNAKPGEVRLH